MFQIKVCGITRPQDAKLASQLGADMIGLILYKKSPRFVSRQEALNIVREVPVTVDKVGVFVNETADNMLKATEKLDLQYVQIHGGIDRMAIKQLQKQGVRVIEAFGVDDGTRWSDLARSRADLILADNASKDSWGGTGQTFDWAKARGALPPNLVLAGGLDADNVAEAVHTFNPLLVDVNSGVESRPGTKSKPKLKNFFTVCNNLRYGK